MLFLDNNNTPVVSNNFYQGETTRASTAQLLSAGYHPITVAYYQGTGGGGLIAYSDSTGTNYIPNSRSPQRFPRFPTSNSVSLAANSSISPYGDVTMGGLSIGGNQLHIVAGNGVGLTFSGGTSLGGSPNFNVNTGMSLCLLGTLSDSGTARTITASGGGNLILAALEFVHSGDELRCYGRRLLGGPGPAIAFGRSGQRPLGHTGRAQQRRLDDPRHEHVARHLRREPGKCRHAIRQQRLDNRRQLRNRRQRLGHSSGSVTLVGSNGLSVPSGTTLNLEALNGYCARDQSRFAVQQQRHDFRRAGQRHLARRQSAGFRGNFRVRPAAAP